MIRLLLVDDHSLFRQGLAALLSMEEDFEIVGQATHGGEAIALAAQLQPDIVLMDVQMPICNGVEATCIIHKQHPTIRILVLSTFEDEEYVHQCLRSGALGYLLKNTPDEQFVAAIRSTYLGYSQLSPTIAPKVFAQLQPHPSLSKVDDQIKLSQRELQVLMLIGQGKNNREIAQTLHLTEGTVRNHVTRILEQLKARDRIQAVIWARHHLLR